MVRAVDPVMLLRRHAFHLTILDSRMYMHTIVTVIDKENATIDSGLTAKSVVLAPALIDSPCDSVDEVNVCSRPIMASAADRYDVTNPVPMSRHTISRLSLSIFIAAVRIFHVPHDFKSPVERNS